MMNSLEHRPLKLSALSPWVPEPYKFAPIEIEPVESPCPRSIQIWSWRPIDLLELRWVKIPVVSFFALALATRLTASRFTDFGRSNLSLILFSFLSFFMLSEKEVLFSSSWFISVDLFKVNFLWIRCNMHPHIIRWINHFLMVSFDMCAYESEPTEKIPRFYKSFSDDYFDDNYFFNFFVLCPYRSRSERRQ